MQATDCPNSLPLRPITYNSRSNFGLEGHCPGWPGPCRRRGHPGGNDPVGRSARTVVPGPESAGRPVSIALIVRALGRRSTPDFLVRLANDLNLLLEIKG